MNGKNKERKEDRISVRVRLKMLMLKMVDIQGWKCWNSGSKFCWMIINIINIVSLNKMRGNWFSMEQAEEEFCLLLWTNSEIYKTSRNGRENVDGVRAGQTSRVTVLGETRHVFIVRKEEAKERMWELLQMLELVEHNEWDASSILPKDVQAWKGKAEGNQIITLLIWFDSGLAFC